MTRQEIFDKALAHLRVQGCQAIEANTTCLYRTSSGLKCAIGALIPDEVYTPDMEGEAAGFPLIYGTFNGTEKDKYFYTDLQLKMHDKYVGESSYYFLEFVEKGAQIVAQKYNLKYIAP